MNTIESGARPAAQGGGLALGALMCLTSMISIQFGVALSAPALDMHGPMGTAWLRLVCAAAMLLVLVRPKFSRYTRRQWMMALTLGATTTVMNICFFAAMQRIPLGLAVAIDFLGPLTVATLGYGLGWRLAFPLLAGAGVLLLSYDGTAWVGNLPGVLFAGGAAVCWGTYILLTKKVGAAFEGLDGLAMSLTAAALVATPFGIVQGISGLTFEGMAAMIGIAILVPLMPYALEMIALRRMPTATFGILMSLEPAFGALSGFLILSQSMTASQMAGTGLVVAASIGATLSDRSG